MPLAVMAIGIAGAFVTMSMSSTEMLTQVKGYKYVSPSNPCNLEGNCTTVIGDLCTASDNTTVLWSKFQESDIQCPRRLYKISN
ncbi:MAG: hypothetical protein WC389_01970 [Lutibacter sp.]